MNAIESASSSQNVKNRLVGEIGVATTTDHKEGRQKIGGGVAKQCLFSSEWPWICDRVWPETHELTSCLNCATSDPLKNTTFQQGGDE